MPAERLNPKDYDGRIFEPKNCPVCATFHEGNVCARCGIEHPPNVHFYGSKSLHFHYNGSAARETITGELCPTCYSDDMFELTGSRPIEPFAPHSR